MKEKCLNCGREINGPLITTPEGDTYHYACVSIDYPEPCGTESRLELLDEEESPLYDFLKFLDENPYTSLLELKDNAPGIYVNLNKQSTLSIHGHNLLSVKTQGSTENMVPLLLQAVAFGWAMERDYPAFADEDELYPEGNPRVPPEEEELSGSGD